MQLWPSPRNEKKLQLSVLDTYTMRHIDFWYLNSTEQGLRGMDV